MISSSLSMQGMPRIGDGLGDSELPHLASIAPAPSSEALCLLAGDFYFAQDDANRGISLAPPTDPAWTLSKSADLQDCGVHHGLALQNIGGIAKQDVINQ